MHRNLHVLWSMAKTNGPRELNLQTHRAPESVWDRRAIAALVCASWSTSEGALVFQHARKMGLETARKMQTGSFV